MSEDKPDRFDLQAVALFASPQDRIAEHEAARLIYASCLGIPSDGNVTEAIQELQSQAAGERTRRLAMLERAQAAEARNSELEHAIQTHRDQKADDRCWMDDQALYATLGDGNLGDNGVGSPSAMLENCKRFIERRCAGDNWPTYVELEQHIAELKKKIAALQNMKLKEFGDSQAYRLLAELKQLRKGQDVVNDQLQARLAAVTAERDAAHDVLRSLASWLGNGGYNADTVDPAVFEAKIRDGVDTILRVEARRLIAPLRAVAEEVVRLDDEDAGLCANDGLDVVNLINLARLAAPQVEPYQEGDLEKFFGCAPGMRHEDEVEATGLHQDEASALIVNRIVDRIASTCLDIGKDEMWLDRLKAVAIVKTEIAKLVRERDKGEEAPTEPVHDWAWAFAQITSRCVVGREGARGNVRMDADGRLCFSSLYWPQVEDYIATDWQIVADATEDE